MTQSGQGQEPHLPAARPAHEGVVLPAEGSETWGGAAGAGPAGGQPWGGQWGPPDGQQQPLPPQQPHSPQPGAYGQQAGAYQQYPQPHQPPQHQAPHQQHQPPQHPQAPQHQASHQPPQHQAPHQTPQQHQAPHQPQHQDAYGTVAQPLPPEVPAGAGDADATQYLPPVAAQGAGAVPGPMPLPAESPAESTQFLGTRPAAPSDADATQYLPPVPPQPSGAPYGIRPGAPGDRQPPAEFDSLFRDDAAATQHIPAYGAGAQAAPHRQPQQPYRAPQAAQPAPPYEDSYREPERRRSSKLPLIAAVVVGCTVLGLGAGALLSGGDDQKKGAPDNTGVAAASSPTPGATASEAAPDPARTQAEALDKLLADSNNSRDSVIRSVENIKKCQNLDQAATDLHAAAGQRRQLVTRLQGLAVDQLPNHGALTTALTQAWQASASADDHYAAWAGEVKGKKGCKGGTARSTTHFAQGNRASGEATTAKRKASELWNGIAGTYGLTPRQPAQL
ncbi:hypothetical protein ACGF5F_20980 [Streptomyces sp. NPDC047821]|uniref:hypothetical protein n=1 Tax=Streptomyces sp. NPDC047821 TaxID=3365488 RepID=UPI003715CB33